MLKCLFKVLDTSIWSAFNVVTANEPRAKWCRCRCLWPRVKPQMHLSIMIVTNSQSTYFTKTWGNEIEIKCSHTFREASLKAVASTIVIEQLRHRDTKMGKFCHRASRKSGRVVSWPTLTNHDQRVRTRPLCLTRVKENIKMFEIDIVPFLAIIHMPILPATYLPPLL